MHPSSTHDGLLAPLKKHLTRPQWQNLVLLVLAVPVARTLLQRRLALFFACAISSAGCYRRLGRVLSWAPAQVWEPLRPVWVRAVLACFAPGEGLVPVLIDWCRCSLTGPAIAIAARASG